MNTMTDARAPSLGPGLDQPVDGRFGRAGVDARFAEVEDPLAEVADDHPVDVATAGDRDAVAETLDALDRDLVGLDEVKRRVREIASLLMVDRMRRSIGLDAEPPTLHMCFTGNPGTGKTTVARRMGQVLHQLGYVRRGHVVAVTREDLVGKYVGHTAPKTQEMLDRAMGGVLFIDEAYGLYRADNERDYGQETVEQLLQVMENERDDLVVIMAGYRDKMQRFFADVPGLASRIGHHLHFPDYDLDELAAMARQMADEHAYRLSPEAEQMLRTHLSRQKRDPRFANGRTVRNALDQARLRHAHRLWDAVGEQAALTKADLVTLEAADIPDAPVVSPVTDGESRIPEPTASSR